MRNTILSHSRQHGPGYVFSPPACPGDPGHQRLDVILHQAPTGIYFDPRRVYLEGVLNGPGSSPLAVHYGSPMSGQFQVVAGPVRILSWKEKVLLAFTFGGQLQINSDEQEAICTLTSPAPILIHYRPGIARFIEDVEIILAERRADWEPKHFEFDKRLAKTDPLIFYAACLKTLREKYGSKSLQDIQKPLRFVNTEIQRLYDEHALPLYIPRLTKLI